MFHRTALFPSLTFQAHTQRVDGFSQTFPCQQLKNHGSVFAKGENLCLRFDECYIQMHRYFTHFTYFIHQLNSVLNRYFHEYKYFFLSDWLESPGKS